MGDIKQYWYFLPIIAIIAYYFYKQAKAPKITHSAQLITSPTQLDSAILSNIANTLGVISSAHHGNTTPA